MEPMGLPETFGDGTFCAHAGCFAVIEITPPKLFDLERIYGNVGFIALFPFCEKPYYRKARKLRSVQHGFVVSWSDQMFEAPEAFDRSYLFYFDDFAEQKDNFTWHEDDGCSGTFLNLEHFQPSLENIHFEPVPDIPCQQGKVFHKNSHLYFSAHFTSKVTSFSRLSAFFVAKDAFGIKG